MHITDTSGLPSNNIRSMYVIGNDVWAGTDQGIARISVREDGTTIKKYSISDGLPSNIINSIYVDGRMVYIGTPEGLCQFDETMLETTSICQLVLTAVRVGDSLLSVRNLYSLSRSQQLAVEFAGISFRSEQEMSYRYRISGVDDNWRTTRLNSLEFTSLPYGDHKLEIIAMNKFGKQSQPLVIAFHVWKPFYKSVWFIILCIISAVLAVIFLYNRRVRAIRQKHVLRLQHEIRIMELEQMALRAQMNPHFIFNCISVMQQLAEEKDVENSRKFISSFSNLVRQTLDNATELLIPLEEETRFLASYLELERIRLEDRFNYVIDTSGVPGIAGLSIPNMVVQPFVENAILHGIRYKKTGTGFISVAFRQQGNLLQCTVTDNGIGRKMALQMRADVAGYHKSKGMGITFKRIESLNALVAGNIHIRVDDLTDEQGTATGTSVIIDFSKINDYD
jgi:hypothetical protein